VKTFTYFNNWNCPRPQTRSEESRLPPSKWKDIYETMETITDRLEDVANTLQGVIVRMS